MKVKIGVAIIGLIALVGLGAGSYAAKTGLVNLNIFQTDVTTSPIPTDIPTPIPSPTDTPVVVPTQQAPVSPISQAPQPFPQQSPPAQLQVPGQTPVVVPEALVTISANVQGDQHCPCPAPLTIEWLGIFQGGFPGVTPIFTWSDGTVGSSDTITYSTPGNYTSPSVKVNEIVNGVTYELAASNPNIPITIT